MKISLLLFAALLLSMSGYGFSDEKLGTVKAFKRTIPIDLEKCKEGYYTSGATYGLCVVRFETKDTLPENGSEVRGHQSFESPQHQVNFEGKRDYYSLDFSAVGSGKTDWETAEPYFRKFLAEQLGGSEYSLTVYKIEP